MRTRTICPYIAECKTCSLKNLKKCHLLTRKLLNDNLCPEMFHQGYLLKKCFCDLHPDIKKIFMDELASHCYINGDCFRALDKDLGDIITHCYFGITKKNAEAIKKIITEKMQLISHAT